MDEVMTLPEREFIWPQSPAQAELVRAMRRLNDQLEHVERPDWEEAEERLLRMARVYGRLQMVNAMGVGHGAGSTPDCVTADVSGGEVAEDAVRG